MTPLIELTDVKKHFRTGDGAERTVLEGVNFTLHEGEIVALLGKSGSGKSTLLRIIAGLIDANGGDVRYAGKPVYAPVAGVAMVFQSFALFPWLTVQENVELGLEAQGISAQERARRADEVLDLIGLAGFGGALPRELSGGMKQRVGIARALVTNPDVLLMDEAFSALDVLTGETLRDDILELWEEKRMSTKAILIVSHNIEEAVMMADRIIVLSSDPGRVRHEIPVALPRPRQAESAAVRALVDQVYALMTARVAAAPAHSDAIAYSLPEAEVSLMEALLDLLADAPFLGRADLPNFAEEAELSDDELFPVYESLQMLQLCRIDEGDIFLTDLGNTYIEADQAGKQLIFGRQLLQNVPLIRHILSRLQAQPEHDLPEEAFIDLLEGHLSADRAEQVLQTAIEWGRYGELFEYDYHTGRLSLPEADEQPST